MKTREFIVPVVLFCLAVGVAPAGDDGEETKKKHPYRGGEIRLAAFLVTNIDTQLAFGPPDSPLGAAIDVSEDLGLADSQNVGRFMFAYRFSRRHRLDLGTYRFRREGFTRLLDWIEIGDPPFEPDTAVQSFVNTDIYKLAYTWLFHDDEKVTLGLGAGIHITAFDVGIEATGPGEGRSEKERLTAPLPVVGGRLGFRVNRKLALAVAANWFFVNYDAYHGQMSDAYLFFEHHTFKHVGFGAGLNTFAMNLQIDDSDVRADLRHVYAGYLVFLTFYF